MKPQVPVVKAINSYKLNVRQVAQKGFFLCPGKVNVSFEENLTALIDSPKELDDNVIKYVLKNELETLRRETLRDFHSMNISNATLFPGLEGFARSLETRVTFDREFRAKNRLL